MSFHKGLIGKSEGGASVKTNDNSFDRYPYMKHSTADPGTEKTLGDYIARRIRSEAFDQVYAEHAKPRLGISQNGQTWSLTFPGPAPWTTEEAIEWAKRLLENY